MESTFSEMSASRMSSDDTSGTGVGAEAMATVSDTAGEADSMTGSDAAGLDAARD